MNHDEIGDDLLDEDTDLVPLGDVMSALDGLREESTMEAAREQLRVGHRTPPHAMDAERAVLGALLLDPTTYEFALAEGLRAAHFHRPQHGVIYTVIGFLHDSKREIGTLTVVDELLKRGQLDRIGGAAAVSTLEALLPTVAHVSAYARLVVEKAQLRSLIDAGTKQVAAAYAQNQSASKIVHAGRADLAEIERGVTTTRGLTGDALAAAIMKNVRREGEVPTYVPIGIPVVDDTVGGVPRGGFMVIAAERKTGKTTTVGHIALHCIENGFKVGVWSFEMQEHEVGAVIAGQHAGVHIEQNKVLSNRELAAMDQSAAFISANVHINAPPGLTAEELSAQLYAYKHRHDLDLVIIENLQGIQLSTRFDQLQANHAHVSNTMRRTIKDLKVAAIFMSQIKTQSEETKRAGKAPLDDAVPQSNAWADDAYLMATMSRMKHHPDPSVAQRVRFQIVANRINGTCPHGWLRYQPKSGRLENCLEGDVPFTDEREQRPRARKTFGAASRHIGGDQEEPAHIRDAFFGDKL